MAATAALAFDLAVFGLAFGTGSTCCGPSAKGGSVKGASGRRAWEEEGPRKERKGEEEWRNTRLSRERIMRLGKARRRSSNRALVPLGPRAPESEPLGPKGSGGAAWV
eukprot:7373858-Pyramimonas_sp.AAC.1